ncbi:anthranilate synthase component II [Salinibius halmophilus]|uniref:anthranilate synthase component II n=1 Tax=Salinibius halmophilus TaxID=1853216 RepID=UPI000E66F019|nr:aminodeoxychorismate/anthranilate synthase component II [Salinibius halmophilus]
MLIVIDNYDSFTYNLVQYLQMLDTDVRVFHNDQITVAELEAMAPDHLLISPGPCSPNEAGISIAAINTFFGKVPILGVCLGHQCIAQAFGGIVGSAKSVMHGKTSVIEHNNTGIFSDLPRQYRVNRYHSLAINEMPANFDVVAQTDDGEIMAIAHNALPVFGVQFHPESILTEHGLELLSNFLTQSKPAY